MSSTDNWDSFLNDEEEQKQIDKWGSYSGGDFEDISVTSQNEAPVTSIQEENLEDFQDVNTIANSEQINEVEYFDEGAISDEELFAEDLPDEKFGREPRNKKPNKKDRNPVLTVVIVVLAIAALLAAVFFAAKLITSNSNNTDENGVEWQENAPSDVVSLVNRYYAAKVLVDTYSLQEILDPSVTIDQESLKNEAEVVEGYQDIVVYTTDGINDGEYAVYVSYAMKFKNISTPAPGFMPAYIKTDSDGKLRYIPWENASQDKEINAFISKVGSSKKITDMADQVDAAYNKALESDKQLKDYIQSLLGTAGEETTAAAETDASGTTAATTTAASTEIKSEDPSTFTECDYMMYAKEDIRLREAPNTDETTSYQNLSKGSYVQVVAKGTQWVKVIDMSTGNSGYCVAQYLQETKPN